jgi:hypothetical protein
MEKMFIAVEEQGFIVKYNIDFSFTENEVKFKIKKKKQ